MRVAVVGSRSLKVNDLGAYLPDEVDEIISGGAKEVDRSARDYALAHGIPLVEILPDYPKYGRLAPLLRNTAIVNRADLVLAFWDGESHGTRFVIDYCRSSRTPVQVYMRRKGRGG